MKVYTGATYPVRAGSMLLLLWATSNARAAPAAGVERYAIAIGNNEAVDGPQRTLRYADDDAIAIHRLLEEAGIDSTLLVEPDADTRAFYPALARDAVTLQQLEQHVSRIAAQVQRAAQRGVATEFWFFYSGHGDADGGGEGYVQLRGQRLTRSRLSWLLKRIGATYSHVIVDACKSNLLVLPRGPGGRHAAYTGPPLAFSSAAEQASIGFMLSTSSGRDSHEWERFHGGILSHELRSALRGAADVDHDRSITYAEVGAFLSKANAAIAPRFRPDFMVRAPEGDFERPVLAWTTEPSLALDAGGWGHVYVESAAGERVLDIHPAPGRHETLWTPAERPLFVRRADEQIEYVVSESMAGSWVDRRTSRRPVDASKGARSRAFELLFAAPLLASDVEQFARSEARVAVTETPSLAPAARADPSADYTATWLIAGGTFISGASALALGVMTRDEFDDSQRFASACERCDSEQIRRHQSTGRTLQTLTNVALAMTVLGVAATGVTFFLESDASRTPRLALGPGAASLTGRY